MAPYTFIQKNKIEKIEDIRSLPVSINLAQMNSGDNITDITGDIGAGALSFFIEFPDDIVEDSNVNKLKSLFSEYKRPGITIKYLDALFLRMLEVHLQ